MTPRASIIAALVVVFAVLPGAGLGLVLLAAVGVGGVGGGACEPGRPPGTPLAVPLTSAPGLADQPPSPVCPDDGAAGLPLTGSPAGPAGRVALPRGFTLPADPRARAAVSFALAAVGRPYVFGAKGPDAYDCSGLTRAAWAAAGVAISAGTLTQVHDGVPVTGLADLAAGDLLFIPGSLGTPTTPRHVGIYAGYGVVVDAYDTTRGVIRERLDDWRGQVVAIRRVSGPLVPRPAWGVP